MSPDEIISALRLFVRRWKQAERDQRKPLARRVAATREWRRRNREHYNSYTRRYRLLQKLRNSNT